jgi:Family of unknown function (DUF5335)
MTTAVQVTPPHWREFFDFLSKTCLGRELTIEVLGEKLGDQTVRQGGQLRGFSFDSRRPGADLLIEGSGPGEALMVHYVRRPRAVWLAETKLGEEADVQVESADRTYTLVRLRRLKALPETSERARSAPRRRAERSPKKKRSRG